MLRIDKTTSIFKNRYYYQQTSVFLKTYVDDLKLITIMASHFFNIWFDKTDVKIPTSKPYFLVVSLTI